MAWSPCPPVATARRSNTGRIPILGFRVFCLEFRVQRLDFEGLGLGMVGRRRIPRGSSPRDPKKQRLSLNLPQQFHIAPGRF